MNANILRSFSDEELEAEMKRRAMEREHIAVKIKFGNRTPVGYFNYCGGDELHTDWELHVVFDNGEKEFWNFSNRHGQSEQDRDTYRYIHFPTLRSMTYDEYVNLAKAKGTYGRH